MTNDNRENLSAEAEVSVLGGMLIDPDAASRAMAVVDGSMFYHPPHRKIFRAMARLSDSDTAIDVITLGEELKKAGELRGAGDLPYLAELLDAVPTARNIEYHAGVVREHAERRSLVDFANRLQLDAGDTERDLDGILRTAQEQLQDFQSAEADPDCPVFVALSELFANPTLLEPPEAIIPRLAHRGRLVILAGPDKSGKSTLLAGAASVKTRGGTFLGEPVAIGNVVWCGLEEAPGDAVRRFRELDADGTNIQMVTPAPNNLLSATRDLLAEWPAGLVVVDSLQEYARVTTDTVPDDGDAAGWATVVRPLAALARKFDVAVVVLHHVRKSDGQYRGSTEIAAAADALLELTMPTQGEDPTLRHIRGRGRWYVEPFDLAFRDGRYEMAGGGVLSLDALLLIHVKESPGISANKLVELAGRNRHSVLDTIRQLIGRGAIENQGTEARAKYHLPSPQRHLEAVV